jgi:hypothetical protein
VNIEFQWSWPNLRQAYYPSVPIQDFKYCPDMFLEALRKPVKYIRIAVLLTIGIFY